MVRVLRAHGKVVPALAEETLHDELILKKNIHRRAEEMSRFVGPILDVGLIMAVISTSVLSARNTCSALIIMDTPKDAPERWIIQQRRWQQLPWYQQLYTRVPMSYAQYCEDINVANPGGD